MTYYHLSTKSDLKYLEPRIPSNYMTKNGFEDARTPRACVAPSISDCIIAVNYKRPGDIFYVYTPVGHVKTKKPTKKEVPDCEITHEVWILNTVKVKMVAIIKITDCIDKPYRYTYGPNDEYFADLYGYNYKVIEKIKEDASSTIINEEAIFDKSHKNPVYIVLMHSGTILANTIRKVTGDEFSHACIAFNSKLDPLYSFGIKGKGEKGIGFSISDPKDKFFTQYKSQYRVYVMYVTDKAKKAIKNKLEYFQNNSNKLKYDWIGLVDIFFGKDSEKHTNKWFCSRFVMELIAQSETLDKVPSLWKPNDINKLENITLVNSGDDFYRYSKKITDAACNAIKIKNSVSDKLTDVGNTISNTLQDTLGVNQVSIPVAEGISSSVIKDFESKRDLSLSTFQKMNLSDPFIQAYKEKYPSLKHIKVSKDTKGFCWMDNKNGLVAILNTEKKAEEARWIQALEIFDPYKGHGLSRQILDVAVKNLYATHLTVNKKNEVAIRLYKTYGFRVYKETDTIYYMYILRRTPKGESVIEESSKSTTLYHGSPIQGLKYIEPNNENINKAVGDSKVVYATNDMRFAACFCGRWNDSNATQGSFDNWKTVTFGITDHVDLSQPCSIYELCNDGSFEQVRTKEFISSNRIKVKKEIKYKSFKEALEKNNVDIISFDEYNERVNESVLTEGIIKDDKDIYYNKDKFDSGEINLCFITGHSGSGKSTMASDIGKRDIEVYDLDDVVWNKENFTMANLREYGDLIYSFFKGPGKEYYITAEESRQTKIFEGRYYEEEIITKFVDYAINYAKSHKNKQYILEGVWLYMFIKPEKLKDFAVYVKGTSALKSGYRAIKRDKANLKDKSLKNTIKKVGTWSYERVRDAIPDEKGVDSYRKYFSKLMNEYVIDEFTARKLKMYKKPALAITRKMQAKHRVTKAISQENPPVSAPPLPQAPSTASPATPPKLNKVSAESDIEEVAESACNIINKEILSRDIFKETYEKIMLPSVSVDIFVIGRWNYSKLNESDRFDKYSQSVYNSAKAKFEAMNKGYSLILDGNCFLVSKNKQQ